MLSSCSSSKIKSLGTRGIRPPQGRSLRGSAQEEAEGEGGEGGKEEAEEKAEEAEEEEEEEEEEGEGQKEPYNCLTPDHPPPAAIMLLIKGFGGIITLIKTSLQPY